MTFHLTHQGLSSVLFHPTCSAHRLMSVPPSASGLPVLEPRIPVLPKRMPMLLAVFGFGGFGGSKLSECHESQLARFSTVYTIQTEGGSTIFSRLVRIIRKEKIISHHRQCRTNSHAKMYHVQPSVFQPNGLLRWCVITVFINLPREVCNPKKMPYVWATSTLACCGVQGSILCTILYLLLDLGGESPNACPGQVPLSQPNKMKRVT